MTQPTADPGPRSAIILAAGMGVRLRRLVADRPKGLLEVGGVPLVQRSLEILRGCGVERVVLVTGYRAEAYHGLLAEGAAACSEGGVPPPGRRPGEAGPPAPACSEGGVPPPGRRPGEAGPPAPPLPSVEVRHNADFACTGSMRSLALAVAGAGEDVLVLESDLLFEPRAVRELQRRPPGNWLLLSGPTGQGDEVYAYGAAGRLALLSKARRHEPLGEFVGISRLTARLPSAMCRHHETGGEAAAAHQYDDCLSDLSATHRIGLHCVDDLVWGEIDDPAQHRRAVSYVRPALSGSPATRARPA